MDDLQIPPAKSPLLQPHRVHSSTSASNAYGLNLVQDPLDDLEFLAPGGWDGPSGNGRGGEQDDEDEEDSDDDLSELDDFSLEEGNIEGVPSATDKLDAK